MAHSVRLKPQKWILADKHFGLLPKKVTLHVSATRPIRWIRFGLIPGLGSFKGNKQTFLFWGVLFLRSQEFRTCEIRKRNENIDYDQVQLDTHHEWASDYHSMKAQMQDHKKPKRRVQRSTLQSHNKLDHLTKEDIARMERRKKR